MNPVFSIFQGDAKTIYLKAVNQQCGNLGDPLDLTDCTEIVINLANADGSITQLKLTDGQVTITDPAVLGKFSAPISASVSGALNVGEFQTFDVTFQIGTEIFTVPYLQALSVFEVA